jgi:hypothetical protein
MKKWKRLIRFTYQNLSLNEDQTILRICLMKHDKQSSINYLNKIKSIYANK